MSLLIWHLLECVRTLQVDIESFISNKYSGDENFRDKDFAKEVKFGIWDVKADENKLTQDINTAIENFESLIRPYLSRS